MKPCLHFLLRPGCGVLELLQDDRDGFLELPESLLAIAGIGQGGAHQLKLGREIRRRGGAVEVERIVRNGEGGADIFTCQDLLEVVDGVFAKAATFENCGGKVIQHGHPLGLRQLARSDTCQQPYLALFKIRGL